MKTWFLMAVLAFGVNAMADNESVKKDELFVDCDAPGAMCAKAPDFGRFLKKTQRREARLLILNPAAVSEKMDTFSCIYLIAGHHHQITLKAQNAKSAVTAVQANLAFLGIDSPDRLPMTVQAHETKVVCKDEWKLDAARKKLVEEKIKKLKLKREE